MICPRCKKEKTPEEMVKDSRTRTGFKSYCKKCSSTWHRKDYEINREKRYAASVNQRRKRKQENREYLGSIMELKCANCGYNKCFSALEFHHINPKTKEDTHDSMATWLSFSLERFKEKINSVMFIILCANCHREETNGDYI